MLDRRSSRILEMQNVRDRVRQLREHLGMKKAEFERFLGVPPKMVWNWERSRTKCPSPEYLVILQNKTGVSIPWLVTGEGPMFLSDKLTDDQKEWLAMHERLTPARRQAIRALVDQNGEPNTNHG